MDKLAQSKKDRRIGFFNELNEDYGPGKLVEKFHETFTGKEGEFAELMNILREVDGDIREIAAPLKNTIKAARSSFNRREYIATIAYLGQYHDGMESITNEFKKLKDAVDFKHNEFLFNGVDEEALSYFKEKLPLKFKPKPKEKTASISDWWSNLTSSKGRALKAWEQRFPKFAKKFKVETERLLSRAESLHNSTSLSLKGMATLRASRKLEEYLDVVISVKNKYNEFDKLFEKYYNSYVKMFLEQQEVFNPKEKEIDFPVVPPAKGPEIKLEESKPATNPNAPALFPDDDEEKISIPSMLPTDKAPESVRQMLGDEDILPPSRKPGIPPLPLRVTPLEEEDILTQRRPNILDDEPVTRRRPPVVPGAPTLAPPPASGERRHSTMPAAGNELSGPITVVPSGNHVSIHDRSTLAPSGNSFEQPVRNTRRPTGDTFNPPARTTRIPTGDTVPPQRSEHPVQVRLAPSNRVEPFERSPSAIQRQKQEPYPITPSSFNHPANDVKHGPPVPANDFRRHTMPVVPLDDAPDSVPVPPVRQGITPPPPQGYNVLDLPAFPKPPRVPGPVPPKKSVHQFLEDLTKLSNESPFVLANEIIKFASTLDDIDASNKLLKIAKGLLK